MSRKEMWEQFVLAEEWGLRDEFNECITDYDCMHLTPIECIAKCYMRLFFK